MLHHIVDFLIAIGPAGVFLLALLDSAGIPLPGAMDAWLILEAVKSPERAWITAGMAIVGSVGGNIALFWAARHGGRRWMKTPDVNKPGKFREWFRRYGLATVFVPAVLPVPPMPLKAFVVSAGVLHTRFGQFFVVILVARVIRYFGEAYLGIRLGKEGAWTFLKSNAWPMVGIMLAVALLVVVVIRFNGRRQAA